VSKQLGEQLIYESLVSTTSLESLVKGYLLNCRTENKSPKTIVGYKSSLRNFVWYCKQNNFPKIQKLTAVHIRHFLWYLGSETNRWNGDYTSARHPASNSTVNHYYRALRTFFNWLEREELIIENPFRHLKTPKASNKIIQALKPLEVERLFKECSGKSSLDVRNKAILSMFLDTGLRLSELINLTLEDVNMDDRSILVKKGKGGKSRVVRIGNKAQKALWKYVTLYRKGNSNRLFLNRSGEPFNFFGVSIFLKRLGNRANVKIHAHQLRHTFAISYLRAGGDVFSLQYLLGHSTLNMTQRYLQSLNANDAANAHKKFSPLDNLRK
jgi:site-specific recombinase XerD